MLSDNLADMDLRAFGAMLREQLGAKGAAEVLNAWAWQIGEKHGLTPEQQRADLADARQRALRRRATASETAETRPVDADAPGGAA